MINVININRINFFMCIYNFFANIRQEMHTTKRKESTCRGNHFVVLNEMVAGYQAYFLSL